MSTIYNKIDICPVCGQEMLINYDYDTIFFYHPAWVKQTIDPPCCHTVSYNDMKAMNKLRLHSLTKENCNCKRHPRKMKKVITTMNKKFINALDKTEGEKLSKGVYNNGQK